MRQCKETGRIDAFRLDWKPGGAGAPHLLGLGVAKWIEAASYSSPPIQTGSWTRSWMRW